MPLFLMLGLLFMTLASCAQPDPAPTDEGASTGASGDAARVRAGSGASVEGGAALGATGVNTRPAVKAEDAEKEARRRAERARAAEKK